MHFSSTLLRAAIVASASILALAPAHGLAQPALTIDLATVDTADGKLRRVHGHVGNGAFGVPVAGSFDCDGDGNRDYAVSAMLADPLGRSDAGEAYLIFGDGTTGGALDTALVQTSILTIIGEGVSETLGSELWMDDVTGDGLGDLLIARQNYRADAGRPGAGALTVVVGGAALRTLADTLAPLDLAAPAAGITLVTFVGAEAVDRLGIWMRTGDVTGDAVADIVVGADQADSFPDEDVGEAYLIRGGAHLLTAGTVDLADFGTTVLAGDIARIDAPAGADEYHLGSTCQIGDLDDNGRGEVMLAAALNRAGASIKADGSPPGSAHGTGGALDGKLFIVWDDNFTGDPWPAGYSLSVDSAPGTISEITGGALNISFGEEILGGLDYDADGNPDLFVGDIVGDLSGSRSSAGSGHLFYDAAALKGLNFDLDSLPVGVTVTDFLGGASGDIAADTALHGDFNGDGIDDLAFGSPHADPIGRSNAGAIHVFPGQVGGFPATIDLAPGQLPLPSEVATVLIQGANADAGSDAGDTLCYSAAAGDVDGDGRDDIITNEMLGNGVLPAAEDTGNLIIISGDLVAGDDGGDACPPAPTVGCRTTQAGRSTLRILDHADPGRDRFKWRWLKGGATLVSEFLTPVAAGDATYRVCGYDDSGASMALTDSAVAAGGTCGAGACWRTAGSSGYRFKDTAGLQSGVKQIKLKAGSEGKATIFVKAGGAGFGAPAPPVSLPLTLQLLISDGVSSSCFETEFSAAQHNEPGRLRARGP